MSVWDGVVARRMSKRELRSWYRGYRVRWKQHGEPGEPPHPSLVRSIKEVIESQPNRPTPRCLTCGSEASSGWYHEKERLIHCTEPTCRATVVMHRGQAISLEAYEAGMRG